MRKHQGDRPEEEIRAAGDHLEHRFGAALERHMHGVDSGARHESLCAQMRRRADAHRGKIQGARAGFRSGHQAWAVAIPLAGETTSTLGEMPIGTTGPKSRTGS